MMQLIYPYIYIQAAAVGSGNYRSFRILETRIDVYETFCPQQMLVHKRGKIKNWGGECRDVTPTKSLSQNIRVDVNREVKFL